ncbi:MAG: DUF3263 domain-containing protein [Actinomycetes bacterium]
MTALTPRQHALLAFAGRTWRSPGHRAQAIDDLFGLSETRYFQDLNAILDLPAALLADPVLVNRLRRQRADARDARSARRLLMWQQRGAA